MVNGIRAVSVQRGYDPRDFVLVGAGGATGLHITALAEVIGIDTIIMSKLASGLCAYGQIISDVKYNYMATLPLRLEGIDTYKKIIEKFDVIERNGIEALKKDGFTDDNISIKRSLEMRYVGQIHECTVAMGSSDMGSSSIKSILQSFHSKHKQLYTYSDPNCLVELVNIESTLYGHINKPPLTQLISSEAADQAIKCHRNVIFNQSPNPQKIPLYEGDNLKVNIKIVGPAIIEEITTTLVIEPGWEIILHDSGTYVFSKLKKH